MNIHANLLSVRPRAGAVHAIDPETGLPISGDYRLTLHSGMVGEVEDVAVTPHRPVGGYETRHQIVIPYLGLFIYSVGRRSWQLDANRILFVEPGGEFRDVHPLPGVGHAALIINPAAPLLDEVVAARPERRGAFADRTRPATARLALLGHALLHGAEAAGEALARDELTVAALLEAFASPSGLPAPRSPAVDRAKQLLQAKSAERLSLDRIAAAVGVTGAYLTSEFKRCEGIPLYRYQLRLRLARALVELPHSDSITALALDLGFSSHSHFGAAFLGQFGMTPSRYRERHEPLVRRKRRATAVQAA
jgi:AraC-like DNA-binding protein